MLVKVTLTIAAVLAVSAFCAFPLMLLWNATLPELFRFPTIDFWMALRLAFLSGILFNHGGGK